MLVHAFAAEAAHRVFADRVESIALRRAATCDRRQAVDVARREGDDRDWPKFRHTRPGR